MKSEFTSQDFLEITKLGIDFTRIYLSSTNFGGVSGANFEIIQKLNLAINLMKTVELCGEGSTSEKMAPTHF